MAVTLTVSHNLFLSKEQRYLLVHGKEVKTVGVSVPVWVWGDNTSEPAMEVFAKYNIKPSDGDIIIKSYRNAYTISMPILSQKMPDKPVVWNSFSIEEQNKWLLKNEPLPSLTNLLDVEDGGSCWLAFRQYGKFKKNKKTINIVHFVEMKDIKELTNSLS